MKSRERGAVLVTSNGRCGHCGGSGHREMLDGAAIRSNRESSGISLRRLANEAEVSPAYLSDIELGRRLTSPHADGAVRILKALVALREAR